MAKPSLRDLRRALLDKPLLSAASDVAIPPENLGADAFDLGSKVGPIYDIIRNPVTTTPLTIAIYGPWGVGKTYRCRIRMTEGNLRIRGFIVFRMFGRTTVWTPLSEGLALISEKPREEVEL